MTHPTETLKIWHWPEGQCQILRHLKILRSNPNNYSQKFLFLGFFPQHCTHLMHTPGPITVWTEVFERKIFWSLEIQG